MIYIAGWSVNHKIKLVRGGSNPNLLPSDSTLEDLLKFKSQEGLRVLLLVWDDPTSRDIFGFQKVSLIRWQHLSSFNKISYHACKRIFCSSETTADIDIWFYPILYLISLWKIFQDGVMKTHDEEARRFFKHSNVQVLLCTRDADKRNS